MPLSTIRNILITDDHPLLLKGISNMISENFPEVRIDTVDNGKKALKKIERKKYDLLITDIAMPELDGIDLCTQIKTIVPELRLIIYTQHLEVWIIKRILKLNVNSIVSKASNAEDIIKAIHAIDKNTNYYSSIIQDSIINIFSSEDNKKTDQFDVKISPREKEILELIVNEKTTRQIASELFISFNTVETYRKNLILKLNVKNTAGLVRKALEYNLI